MTKRRQQPIPIPTATAAQARAIQERIELTNAIIPHIQEIAAAGAAFGHDLGAFITDLTMERVASMRRAMDRISRSIDGIESALAPAPKGASQ